MHLESSSAKVEQQFYQAVERSLEKRPALETVIKPFAAVLVKRASIVAEISAFMQPMDMDRTADRLASGVPMVTDISLADWKMALEKTLANLMPVLNRSFPNLKADFSAIEAAIKNGESDLSILAKAYLEGNCRVFQSSVQNIVGAAGALGFVVNWTLSAVLNAARIQWENAVDLSSWSKGYCPVCGSLPAISYLSKPNGPTSEFLRGGGGQKFLHCALCGQNWRFKRNRCPACDTDDKDNRIYYREVGETSERFDACRHCGHYLLGIDLRENNVSASLDMAAVGMVHLDILARGKGFSPMTWTPWNRIDEG